MSNAYKYKSYFIMAIQQNLKNTVVYFRSKLEKKTQQHKNSWQTNCHKFNVVMLPLPQKKKEKSKINPD